MDKVKKTQRTLLAINALKIVLTIFTTTFFTSYIVALTPDNILGEGVFNIGVFYLYPNGKIKIDMNLLQKATEFHIFDLGFW